MGTSLAPVRARDVSPDTSRELEGQAAGARQVFVDERGVRRRLIRAGERGLAVAVAGVLMMGVGGMVGAPWVPHLKLPLIGGVGLAGPASRPEAAAEAPGPAPQPDPTRAEPLRATKPVPAPSPGPSVPVLAVARVSQTNAATAPAQVSNPPTSVDLAPSTAPSSSPQAASPASGGPTTQPSPDPSPSPTPEPSDQGQTVAAAHSQSKADPSPGPRSAKAK
jgi:hypothetical protein